MGSNSTHRTIDPALAHAFAMLGPAMAERLQRDSTLMETAKAVHENAALPAELHEALVDALKTACADASLDSAAAPHCIPRYYREYAPYRQMADAAIEDLAGHLSVAMLDVRKGTCRGIDTSRLHEATKPQSMWRRSR